MYKMNFDRVVLALWDEKLKEDLHESYYSLIQIVPLLTKDPQSGIDKIKQRIVKGDSPFSVVAKFIIEIEDPDLEELYKFIVKYKHIISDRIVKILDSEEILVQVKRRRLLD